MEEKEMLKFSWSIFICVTAVSFMIFSGALSLLEAPNSGLFFKLGLGLAAAGIVTVVANWSTARNSPGKKAIGQQPEDLF